VFRVDIRRAAVDEGSAVALVRRIKAVCWASAEAEEMIKNYSLLTVGDIVQTLY
jgi:hypothetical protein